MNMKKNLILTGALVLAATAAQATIYDSGTQSSSTIVPDNNQSGLASTYSFATGDANTINGVSVTLNITGGYNGDLYGYLVNPNGNMAILLNRVGQVGGNSGYANAGMNVTLTDFSAQNSIQTYQSSSPVYVGGQLTGNWAPAGDFTALHNGGVDGQWTLFLADLSAGDQSTLVSWDLSISVVPEPVTWALMIFGGVLGAVGLARWRTARLSA
jgi:subtilisin-like proprotein convertase family protein